MTDQRRIQKQGPSLFEGIYALALIQLLMGLRHY